MTENYIQNKKNYLICMKGDNDLRALYDDRVVASKWDAVFKWFEDNYQERGWEKEKSKAGAIYYIVHETGHKILIGGETDKYMYALGEIRHALDITFVEADDMMEEIQKSLGGKTFVDEYRYTPSKDGPCSLSVFAGTEWEVTVDNPAYDPYYDISHMILRWAALKKWFADNYERMGWRLSEGYSVLCYDEPDPEEEDEYFLNFLYEPKNNWFTAVRTMKSKLNCDEQEVDRVLAEIESGMSAEEIEAMSAEDGIPKEMLGKTHREYEEYLARKQAG